VGRALCRLALQLAREKGALLGALYPFRVDYYRRIGYALVGELHRYRFLSAELCAASAEGTSETGVSVERIPREEAGRRLAAPYQALLSRSNGLVERTPEMWKGILDDAGHAYGATDAGGKLRGYLLAHGRRGRSPDRSILRVRECLALDGGAREALLRWISDQRDQWRWVEYDALPGEGFHRLLPHPRQAGRPHARGLWFPSATLLRGPMLRIVNLGRVLETVGFPAGATLAVADPELPENAGEWCGGGGGPRRTDAPATPAGPAGVIPPRGSTV
jgi:predicted acetyltransferase